MTMASKICGLSSAGTLDAAVAHGASYIGLVFFEASPRHISFDLAERLAARVPDPVRRVGIFVDPDDALIDRATATGRLDVIQLHKASPARGSAIAMRTGCEIWSAIPVRAVSDLSQARHYVGSASRLLYDAKTCDDALPGGMGVRFDWNLLRGFGHPLPWALSGGLDASNVAEAVRVTRATLVDVSSGVESAPGVKDVDKIAAFLKAAKQL